MDLHVFPIPIPLPTSLQMKKNFYIYENAQGSACRQTRLTRSSVFIREWVSEGLHHITKPCH